MASPLFVSLTKKRELIITLFKISYLLSIVFTLFGIWSLYAFNQFAFFMVDFAYTSGQIAVLLFVATVIPGIYRRFGRSNEVVNLLMMFRRYIGILMYLFVVTHYWFMVGVDVLKNGPPQSVPPNIMIGSIASYLLLALALTSNDWSTKRLGIWWHRIHNLIYIIVWLIFLHLALVSISVWTIIIGMTALAVLASHLYPYIKKHIHP